MSRFLSLAAVLLATMGIASSAPSDDGDGKPSASESKADSSSDKEQTKGNSKEFPKELFSGTVVLAQEALGRRGIKVADEMKSQAVLETTDGKLIPIAADWRGRAFYQDKRLRNRRVDLVAYRQPGIPYLRVLGIYFVNRKGDHEAFDYWCDVCSIPMYEIKDCECCQGPIRLRYRKIGLPKYLKKSDSKPPDASGPDQKRGNAEGKPAK